MAADPPIQPVTTRRPRRPSRRAASPRAGAGRTAARHTAAGRTVAGRLVPALVAALVVASCGGATGPAGGSDALTAPVTELAGGAPTTLADAAAGRPTVVNLWASWCVPCLDEMPAFEEVHLARGEEVAIVGVTDDRPEAASAMAEQTGVTYPLLIDESRAVARSLGAAGLPLTVFVGPDGEVLGRHQGALDAEGLQREIDRYWGVS